MKKLTEEQFAQHASKLLGGCLGAGLGLSIIALVCAWTGATTLLQGWVLARLWHWFIVPGFRQPDLAWPTAVGVVFIAHTLAWQPDLGVKEKTAPWALCLSTLTTPLLTLGIGYLLHLITEGR